MLTSRIWHIYHDIGSTACLAGDCDIAAKMFTQAIEICSNRSMQRNKVKSLIGLADTLVMQKQAAEATRTYKRALNIFARIGAPEHADKRMLAHVLEKLGYLYEQEDRQEDAIKMLQRSVRVSEQIIGAKHPSLVHRLLKIASLHIRFNETEESMACFNRVQEIRSLTNEHPLALPADAVAVDEPDLLQAAEIGATPPLQLDRARTTAQAFP